MSLRALCVWLVLARALGAGAEPMEGVDYAVLPQRVAPAGERIEVIEFFYYGCSACARLEPVFDVWRRGAAKDVSVVRVPAAYEAPRWTALARLYYALEQMNLLEALHADVFLAIHQRNRDLALRDEQLAWVKEAGHDPAQFAQVLDSQQVAQRLQFARDLTQRYGVRHTPSLIVDGQYLVNGAITGSLNSLLPISAALIDKVRNERRAQK